MGAVKDHIRIFYIGLGVEESHNAYSKYGHTYKADELLKTLMETEIPLYVDLKRKGKLPTVAPLKLPCLPNVATLVTMSELGNDINKQTEID